MRQSGPHDRGRGGAAARRPAAAGRRGHGAPAVRPGRRLAVQLHQPVPARGSSAGPSTDCVGRVIWEEFPEAVGSPFERTVPAGREHGRARQLRGLVRARWADLVPGRRVPHRRRAGRHLRRRHRAPPHRGARRRRAARRRLRGPPRGGGRPRHLMLLGDINLAMTSTLDTDEAVDRFAHLVVPAARRLVPGQRRSTPTAPAGTSAGRTGDPALVAAMHRYADLRVADQPGERAGAAAARADQPAGDHRRSSRPTHRGDGGRPGGARGAGAAAARRRRDLPADRPRRGVRRAHPGQRARPRAAHRRRSCGRRRSPPAGRRSRWTTPGSPRPTSRWPSGSS